MPRPSPIKRKRQGTTSADIFERLIEAILSGRFPASTSLREAKLAREWNVSRTPMREAVRRAAEAGFVVLRPNQAPTVRALNGDDIRELYDLRELLEMRAFDLAWKQVDAGRLDDLEARARAARPGQGTNWVRRCLDFDIALHRLWMDRCGNSWLIADLEWLYQFLRIVQGWMSHDRASLALAYEEHVSILSAVRQGNKTLARRHLRAHIRHAAESVSNTIVTRHISS
jgi:DNA-binding GntR family transcriptional regulator